MFIITPGDVIIVNNWDGNFLSRAIRFFTRSWSHCAIGFYPILSSPAIQTVFESNLTTGITNWDDIYMHPEKYDVRVYRWKPGFGPSPSLLRSLFDKYNGNSYGAAQLLWFVWRWVVEKLHLPSRWARKNFFPNKEICSEVDYMQFELRNDPIINAILAKLNKNQNTVHPGDIIVICEELRSMGMLELVYNREKSKS